MFSKVSKEISAKWERGVWMKATLVILAVEWFLLIPYFVIWLLFGLELVSPEFEKYYSAQIEHIVVALVPLAMLTSTIAYARGEVSS